MMHTPFEVIDAEWVQHLVDSGIEEQRHLDYKRELSLRNDGEKKEFYTDVSSFANADGGYLIYGVKEEEGKPTSIVGLPGIDTDRLILQMESVARDNIEPRPRVETRAISGPWNDHPVIVMKVHRSWNTPHMIKGGPRFFSRTSKGKYPLDVSEIRTAFAASEELPLRMRRFRDERLALLDANEAPVRLCSGAFLALHMIPFSAFRSAYNVDMAAAHASRNLLISRYFGAGSFRVNLDGLLLDHSDHMAGLSRAYTQVFRNGCLEAVETTLLDPNFQPLSHTIPTSALEQAVISCTDACLKFLFSQDVAPPISVFLTVCGVRGRWLATRPEMRSTSAIDRDKLLLPDAFLEEYPDDVASRLRPVFDALWQSAGELACPNYDTAGKYRSKG